MAGSKVFFTDRKAQAYYNMLDKPEHVLKELSFLLESGKATT
jgi:hypothetical protein